MTRQSVGASQSDGRQHSMTLGELTLPGLG